MTTHLNKDQLLATLEPFGQQHLLAFWDELADEARSQLASQIGAIDVAQIGQLYSAAEAGHDWAAMARRAEPPPAVRLDQRGSEAAQQRGEQALRNGKVGVLIVAGGQGSRLGFDQPKGMFPIGTVSGASLLEIHLQKALAAARRYDQPVPVYIMSSPATRDEQAQFLAENDRFGLAEDDVFLFCQGTMPAVDAATGQLLLAEKDRLFLSPDGHGGTVAALAKSGAIDHMRRRGIEHLFYLQVDNPLVPICDATLVGHHLEAGSELTSIAVAKLQPDDKLGNFATIDDQLHVIEYSDFPSDVAEQRTDDGSLRFWAGSIAVHVFAVAFLERSLELKDGLPFHVAHKKVPHIDATGQPIEPTEPNALKFERFIFDLMPHARNAIVVEYAETDCFAPLKNAPGAPRDTAEYVQRLMADQHRGWLRAAGAKVPDDVTVEINPLWALDAAAVAARIEPGTVIDEPIYLCE